MNVETVALASLHHPEVNARLHPEAQIQELIRSIEMFGQTRPIVADEDGTVLVGNGLLAALNRLEKTTAEVLRMTGLSASEKAKLMLSDNRIFVLGMDDYDTIMQIIRALPDLDIPGYDEQSLRSLTDTDTAATAASLEAFGTIAETPNQTRTATPRQHREPQRIIVCQQCGKEFVLGKPQP